MGRRATAGPGRRHLLLQEVAQLAGLPLDEERHVVRAEVRPAAERGQVRVAQVGHELLRAEQREHALLQRHDGVEQLQRRGVAQVEVRRGERAEADGQDLKGAVE